MMSAAARSRREETLCSESILQRLQIEIAVVNPDRRHCSWWNGRACAGLARADSAEHRCVPLSFHITNFFGRVTVAVRVLEVRHVRGEIKKAGIGNQ